MASPDVHLELPQQASSSSILRSEAIELSYLIAELIRRHRAPSTLNPDAVPRTPPPRDGDLMHGVDIISVDAEGGFGAVPASGAAIVRLPETVVASESEAAGKECAVCLEAYAGGDALRTMPCSHGFHESCIFGWLRVSRLCPLRRFALPAATAEESNTEDGDVTSV